jgi:glycosyltransferase involved in cell wall biosynthesis
MILSILIAAFNVERFLDRCLSSIADQFSDLIEVIIVDDGSTDGTSTIAARFAARYTNISLVRQENSGLGAARNAGLSHARGRYVWFVDGDDFVSSDALRSIVSALNGASPDVLVLELSCADERGAPIDWIESGFRDSVGKTMTGAAFFRRHYRTTYAFLFIFRRELLFGNQLAFRPRINMQDAEFLPRALAVADRVFVSGIVAYVYVKRSNSYINSTDPLVRQRYFRSAVEVRRRLSIQFEQTNDAVMREGLCAKVDAVDGILMMAYVYDEIDAKGLATRLAILREERIHPFSAATSTSGRRPSVRDRVIRTLVNWMPSRFPPLFRSIRRNSLLREVLHSRLLKVSGR